MSAADTIAGMPALRDLRDRLGKVAEQARIIEVRRVGQAALSLRDRELRLRRVTLEELKGRGQRRAAIEARQSIAFLAWTECEHLSLADVASLIGRSDHSAAVHAILAGARTRGIIVAKVSQLRGHADPVDWTKLAYHAAGAREAHDLTIDQAARKSEVGRGEWRKVEQGRAVSTGTMLKVCRWLQVDPFSYLASRGAPEASPAAAPAWRANVPDARSGLRPSADTAADASHETDGKHEVQT